MFFPQSTVENTSAAMMEDEPSKQTPVNSFSTHKSIEALF